MRLCQLILAAFLLIFAQSGGALAEPRKLSAPEVRALLAGHTAVGSWSRARYRQWFAIDGSTIYAQWGARSAVGKWRVNDLSGDYESWWGGDPDHWDAYWVLQDDKGLYWGGVGLDPVPFTLLDGQQLVWP